MTTATAPVETHPVMREHPVLQAFRVLNFAYAFLPILAGLDKFTHLLVNWDHYLAPRVAALLPFSGHVFMRAVGVVEVIAGIIVALRPDIGGWIVMLWLWGIVLNLLIYPGFLDVALRDFGLSLGALSLALLARSFRR